MTEMERGVTEMSEIIVRMNSDHIKVKGGEYVQDLVRCKECRYRNGEKCQMRNNIAKRFPQADDYCSYGEREGE